MNRKIFILLIILLICTAVKANDDYPTRQKLTPAEERKFDYFFYEGLKLKHAAKFDSSFEMFRHCLEIDSTSSAALFELSVSYILFDHPEKAVPLLKNAVAYSPENNEYRGTLASLLLNLGMFGEASEEYEKLSKVYPDRPELFFYLAESYSRSGETGKAIDTFNELENIVGMNETVSMEKYRLYTQLQQPDSALNEVKKLADKYMMDARYQIILGDLFLRQNDLTKAFEYYQKARETDPESPYYFVSMANYYEKTGQADSAKQQILAALANERLQIDNKLEILGYVLRNPQKDLDEVGDLFKKLIEMHPDESRLKLFYGEYLTVLKKFDEARFQIQLITESEPENLGAWQQLIELTAQTKELDETIRISEKCMEIFPEELMFPYYLGTAYYQKKDYKSAIATFEKAIQLIPAEKAPSKSDFYSMIGDAYFKMRETDKAFNAYEEALKYNDKNIMALNNYAYYLSLMKKDLSKAERMSAITVKMEPNNATYIDTYAWIFFKQGNFPLAKIFMEQAINKDRTNSAELFDHYGDILYFSDEKEKAVEQWEKARDAGKNTATVNRKIKEKTYFEGTEDEIFNDLD